MCCEYNNEGLNFSHDLTKVEYEFLVYLFKKFQNESRKTFQEKNKMYEASFFKQCEEDGDLSSAVMRIKDKVNRISSLVKNPERDTLADETIKDTLKDLSNYALMSLVFLEVQDRDRIANEVRANSANKQE